ncbi:retron system putative HNH endonuclease [uncultured Shewanella sp.]|uniref:retron system putative HNH endonuclease n=1 Tax=uncultured Shewanella sp. TaxID=173975 RepID=UPI00370477B3
MKQIFKSREPKSLLQYRNNVDAIYDGPNFTPVKSDIRESLLKEQGYLCAYCMRRISINRMKIEHFLCQKSNPDEQLNYSNLLGCCEGGEGSRPAEQTCDTKKGSKVLTFSPVTLTINTLITYSSSGLIESTHKQFSIELNDVLNLNKIRLKENRAAAQEGIEELLNSRAGKRSKAELKIMIDKYINVSADGKFKEYYGCIIFYLRKKHSKAK